MFMHTPCQGTHKLGPGLPLLAIPVVSPNPFNQLPFRWLRPGTKHSLGWQLQQHRLQQEEGPQCMRVSIPYEEVVASWAEHWGPRSA